MTLTEKHWILLNSPDQEDLDWLYSLKLDITVDYPNHRASMYVGGVVAYFTGATSVKIVTYKEEEELFLKLRFGNNLALTTILNFDDRHPDHK